jgi:heme-degrading monooxygenase HmoA
VGRRSVRVGNNRTAEAESSGDRFVIVNGPLSAENLGAAMVQQPMFMQLARVRVRAGCWSDYEWAVRTQAVSDVKSAGFTALWLIRDASDEDVAHVISLWGSKEVAEEYYRGDLWRRRWQEMKRFVVGEMEVVAGEVHLWPQINQGRSDWVSRW